METLKKELLEFCESINYQLSAEQIESATFEVGNFITAKIGIVEIRFKIEE